MKAAMVTFYLKPGKTDEFVNRVQDVLDKTRDTPGLGPIYLVSDPAKNACMTFGIWETAEEAALWPKNEEFIRFLRESGPLFVSEPVRKVCDVLMIPKGKGEERVA